jgi:hypothetical protein
MGKCGICKDEYERLKDGEWCGFCLKWLAIKIADRMEELEELREKRLKDLNSEVIDLRRVN